jgi:CheY-like chemotaxis protein
MTVYALIIDDLLPNVEALALLLGRHQVTPIIAITPDNLETVLEQVETVNLVFLDLEMPYCSGFEVLRQLQADTRFRNVPIVAYTVHTDKQNEARQAGFHSFLGKPLNVKRFPDQLRRILSGIPVWEV